MTRADIVETCSCGATLHVVMDSLAYARATADKWRKDHRHDFPPQPTPEPERHDTTLDAMVEHSDHRDANPKAELDYRTRMGFRP